MTPAKLRPQVICDPAMRYGDPAVKGVSVDAIVGALMSGDDVQEVARDFGLTRPDVLVAAWYAGWHGLPDHKNWRKRLRKWAKAAGAVMWDPEPIGGYDVIPDPPTGEVRS